MAQYEINFQTNASQVERDIALLQRKLSETVQTARRSVKIDIDASGLSNAINTTFRKINREIENNQRKLSRLQIGGGNFQQIAQRLGRAEGLRERGQLIAQPTRLRAQAESFEPGSLVATQKVLQAIRIEASQVKPNSQEWIQFQKQLGDVALQMQRVDKAAESIQLTQQMGALAPGSLAQLETRLTVLRNRAREIAPNTEEWQNLNREIQKTESGIEKVSRKPMGAGQRLGAAGGAFLYGGGLGGGIGSAVGGIAGGLAGGVPGAFAGAAFGQLADNLGMALSGMTTQASTIQQLQRGLAMASVDAKDFANAQATVVDISQRLLMPLEQTTRLFTQLRVNTKEYNLSVADTAQIMEGTALAIMSTGGSAQDMEGAMRAVVQILSKGGVQAEELRGQLGERFPGAVVKFAQANKMSFEELQDALQKGTVGIAEFVKFAQKNYSDYAKFSEQLATAPEFAGQRLQIALERVGIAIGSVFAQAGAGIQDTLTETLNELASFIKNNEKDLKTLGDGLTSLLTLAKDVGKAFVDFIGRDIAQAFLEAARAARTIRNMLGKGDIQSVANEREDIDNRLRAKDKEIATEKGKSSWLPNFSLMQAEFERGELQKRRNKLEQDFRGLGGNAALRAAQPGAGFVFGGPGAGASLNRSTDTKDQERRAKQYLDAIENREEAIARARIDREERLAQIREDAVEKAKRLEEDLAKQRLDVEREIEKARREINAIQANLGFDIQALESSATGGSPEVVRFQQEIFNAARKRDEEKIALEQRLLDEQTQRAKAIEDLKITVAKSINEANARYAKAIGNAQLRYARATAKIAEESSQRSAKRLEIAGRLAAISTERANLNYFRVSAGREPIPEPTSYQAGQPQYQGVADIPGGFLRLDREYSQLLKRLNQLPASSSAASSAVRAISVNTNDLTKNVTAATGELDRLSESLKTQLGDKLDAEFASQFFQGILSRTQELEKLSTELRQDAAEAVGVRTFRQQKGFSKDVAQAAYDAMKAGDDLDKLLHKAAAEISTQFTGEKQVQAFNTLKQIQDLVNRMEIEAATAIEALAKPKESEAIADAILDAGDALKEMTTRLASVKTLTTSVSESFGSMFGEVLKGTSTFQQALSNAFQNIGNAFADMVSQMLTEWLKLELLKIAQRFLNPQSSKGPVPVPVKPFANGGVAFGGFTPFASGGVVTGPTLGLVGEGRYNEAVVPMPDGKSIPVNLGGAAGNNIATNIVINMGNGQGSGQISGTQGNQLARELEGAVKQVILKETRPGGIIYSQR